MIPAFAVKAVNMTQYEYPSKTYNIDFEKNIICGFTDKQAAVSQSIMLTLGIERYAYIIMPRWYGAEIEHFIGKDYDYIKSAIEGEIREAISMDNRISDISNFTIEKVSSDSCLISFVADTQFGAIVINKELRIV